MRNPHKYDSNLIRCVASRRSDPRRSGPIGRAVGMRRGGTRIRESSSRVPVDNASSLVSTDQMGCVPAAYFLGSARQSTERGSRSPRNTHKHVSCLRHADSHGSFAQDLFDALNQLTVPDCLPASPEAMAAANRQHHRRVRRLQTSKKLPPYFLHLPACPFGRV